MGAAPMVFLPLGWILLRSGLLPRALAYLALGLGAVFFILGMLYPLQGAVDALSALQGAGGWPPPSPP